MTANSIALGLFLNLTGSSIECVKSHLWHSVFDFIFSGGHEGRERERRQREGRGRGGGGAIRLEVGDGYFGKGWSLGPVPLDQQLLSVQSDTPSI